MYEMLSQNVWNAIPRTRFRENPKHTWSPLLLTWQAYLVRNKTDMASMFSPLYNQYGKHTWSLS